MRPLCKSGRARYILIDAPGRFAWRLISSNGKILVERVYSCRMHRTRSLDGFRAAAASTLVEEVFPVR
jgi:hypothetical protein